MDLTLEIILRDETICEIMDYLIDKEFSAPVVEGYTEHLDDKEIRKKRRKAALRIREYFGGPR